MRVTIVGAGTIGSTVGYSLAVSEPDIEVTLVDIDEELAAGHATDATHAVAHAAHPFGAVGSESLSTSPVRTAPPGPEPIENAECLVVAASAPRPATAGERGGRIEWLENNLDVAETVGEWMRDANPVPVLSITNPQDVISYGLYRKSGWPRECILGYSMSETARLADHLAREYDTAHRNVSCPILGEHGEHIVPVFSRATVDGEPLELTNEERRTALEYTRDVAYEVLRLRGRDQSSRWVTGQGAALVIRSLASGGIDEPVGVSVPLEGEYGYRDVCLGVPVTLDRSGVDEIVEWSLSDWEQNRLDEAAEFVRSNVEAVGW